MEYGCVEMANVVMRAQEARPPTGRAVGIGWRDGRGQGLQGARCRERSLRRPFVRPFVHVYRSVECCAPYGEEGRVGIVFAPIALLIDKVSSLWCLVTCLELDPVPTTNILF